MNEQEVFLKIGELAGRIGYPTPAISWVEAAPDSAYVCLNERGAMGPVLELRSDIAEIPDARFEFLVAQELVRHSLGAVRYFRWQRGLLWTFYLLLGIGLGYRFGGVGLLLLLAIGLPVATVFSATWSRRFTRRVDRRLAEIFGPRWLADGLQDLMGAWNWRHDLRWLWRGAPPQPPDRLKRLGASEPAS